MGKLQKFGRAAAIVMVALAVLVIYLLRGGFRRFEATAYPAPPAAFTNWNEVLAHPRDIALTTLRTGFVHMDACLNLDPASPKQANCDHAPRDLAVLAHWVHHPQFGDFLIDAGFDDSFAKNPPYGDYAAAMSFFNWMNGITNRQEPGTDLAAQLAHLNVHPKAVFITHLHPDHTAGATGLGPQTQFVFGKTEASFLARAGTANHFASGAKFSSIDFAAAPAMKPLGPAVDLLGDGSFWAISAPGHTDDDMAFLINAASPVLLTGDASHFAWAFENGVAPHGWDSAGTARGYVSVEQLRNFAKSYPAVKVVYGHEEARF